MRTTCSTQPIWPTAGRWPAARCQPARRCAWLSPTRSRGFGTPTCSEPSGPLPSNLIMTLNDTLTTPALIARGAARYGARIAVETEHGRYSYAQLDAARIEAA